MGEFDAIRPYGDVEVSEVLRRLLRDEELLRMLAGYRFPRLSRWLPGMASTMIAAGLRREVRGIDTVDALQHRLEPWWDKVIERSALTVTYSGLEHLSKTQPNLFLANHRDIAMDPAFVNYALYHGGHPTPRIAIGDNLLQRPFVSDLMRLNKCFIVHRSVAGRREKLAVYQTLSAYINHSILSGHSVWIAQAEGRAKDGCDRTDTAIIKMLCMSRKGEDFADVVRSLTPRELEIVRLVAQGMSNQEVAATLYLGQATVKSHLASAQAKLGVRNRVQVGVLVAQAGLMDPPAPG